MGRTSIRFAGRPFVTFGMFALAMMLLMNAGVWGNPISFVLAWAVRIGASLLAMAVCVRLWNQGKEVGPTSWMPKRVRRWAMDEPSTTGTEDQQRLPQ